MSHRRPLTSEHSLRPRPGAPPVGWRMPRRAQAEEWLDQGLGSPADVAANLAEMARLNRWLGGLRALTRHLFPRLAAAPDPLTVLDLGTGAAGTALAVAAWARRRRRAVRVLALDCSARHLSVARAHAAGEPSVRLLRADALALPLAPRSVDFVISTLCLHHFDPGQAVALLRAAAGAARRGVLVSDLSRGWLPLAAFKLVGPVLARHPFTRHDGALSIRRAYTAAELAALARAAGLAPARVHAHWPWRLTLVADLNAAPAAGARG